MIAVIALLALAALLRIILNQRKLMANVSTLTARLQALQSKVDNISVNVQTLKDQAAGAGEIPPDAEALLTNLGSTLDALAANVAPAQPSPLP